jgi:hypothetical protein
LIDRGAGSLAHRNLYAIKRNKITTPEGYASAFKEGKLPKGFPVDPAQYPEWSEWGWARLFGIEATPERPKRTK